MSGQSREPFATTDCSIVQTTRGRRLALGRTVEATPETVWEVFTDVTYWPEWGPPVSDVETPEQRIFEGTTGRVQVFDSLWVPFEITGIDGRCWTWSAWGVTPPADGHRVDELGGDRCRVVLELPLWAPWYLPLCWVALRNISTVAQRLEA